MVDKRIENDVIAILTSLCRLLSRDPLSVDDVLSETANIPLAVTIEPKPGTDIPAFVRLVLAESSQLSLDTLQEAFGPYRELPRIHRQAGAEYIFYVDWPEYPYTCALIAETQFDQEGVQALIVRRDIRLE